MAASHCRLLTGSLGWDNRAWNREFYPDDLPKDWRLAYYANEFPAVLVPDRVLAGTDESFYESWVDDVPEDFRFYLQVGPRVTARSSAERFLACLSPLEGYIAGAVMVADCPNGVPRDWPATLGERLPLAVVGGQAPSAAPVWSPGTGEVYPGTGACLGRLPTAFPEVRALREVIAAYLTWCHGCQEALLYLEPVTGALQTLRQARVLAELLGG